jgi:hypothetical protein
MENMEKYKVRCRDYLCKKCGHSFTTTNLALSDIYYHGLIFFFSYEKEIAVIEDNSPELQEFSKILDDYKFGEMQKYKKEVLQNTFMYFADKSRKGYSFYIAAMISICPNCGNKNSDFLDMIEEKEEDLAAKSNLYTQWNSYSYRKKRKLLYAFSDKQIKYLKEKEAKYEPICCMMKTEKYKIGYRRWICEECSCIYTTTNPEFNSELLYYGTIFFFTEANEIAAIEGNDAKLQEFAEIIENYAKNEIQKRHTIDVLHHAWEHFADKSQKGYPFHIWGMYATCPNCENRDTLKMIDLQIEEIESQPILYTQWDLNSYRKKKKILHAFFDNCLEEIYK